MMNSPYTMVIQWSDEDNCYLVHLPDFPFQQFHTHGDTYEEAAKHGQEVIDSLIEWYREEGKSLPQPSKISASVNLPFSQLNTNIDIEPELIESNFDDYTIPSLPIEVYSAFKKAWNEVYQEVYQGICKPLTSATLKSLWKEWYHPDLAVDIEEWGANWEDSKFRNLKNEQEELVDAFYYEFLDGYCGGPDWIYLAFVEFISKFMFDGELLELSKINPSSLDSVLLDEHDDLPEKSGIYFVLDESGTIHYIGMSVNLYKRWFSHHRQEDFDLIPNARIAYISDLPKHYLRNIETTLIQSFLPHLNKQGKPCQQ